METAAFAAATLSPAAFTPSADVATLIPTDAATTTSDEDISPGLISLTDEELHRIANNEDDIPRRRSNPTPFFRRRCRGTNI